VKTYLLTFTDHLLIDKIENSALRFDSHAVQCCTTAFILDCFSVLCASLYAGAEWGGTWFVGRTNFSCLTLLNAEMETTKNGSSKLIVMTVLEPKDELDEVKFS